MPKRPNVVFVLTDDQGYPPIGRHGHPFIRTPHLDAFHDEAVVFDQFHTGTTCAPTRAGIMTGHYCNSTGVWHTIGGRSLLRADEWSLATALGGVTGHGLAILPLVGTIAIYFLEVLVAFIQAYIFTFLTGLFLGQLVVHDHDEHGEHAEEATAH